MFLTKLKTIAGVMLIVASLCGAAGLIYPTQASEQPKARKAIEKADKEKQPGARNNEKSEPAKQQKPKNDREAIRGVWRVISVQHGDEDGADERDMMSKECRWVIHTHSIDMRSQGGMVGLNYKLDPSRSPKVLDLQLLGRNIPTIYALEGDILRIRMGLHEKTRPKALFTKTPGQTMLLTLKREPTKPKAPKAIEKADKEIQPTAKKPRPDKEQLQGKWKIIASVDDGKKELNVAEEWTFKDSMVKAVSPAAYFRFRLNETTNPKRIDFAEGKADDLFDMAAFEKRLDNADARNEGIYALIGDTLIICISRTKGERPTAFESKEGSDYILMTLQRQRPQDDKKPQEKGGKGEVTRPRTDKETAQSFRLVPHSHTFRLKAREFTIPVHVDPDAKLKRLQLNVSVDAGETWQTVDSIPTTARAFRFKAPKDGTYWFIVQSVFRDGKLRPVALLRPDLKIVVDTTNKPDND